MLQPGVSCYICVGMDNYKNDGQVRETPIIAIFNSPIDYDVTTMTKQSCCLVATQKILFMLRQEVPIGIWSRNVHLQVRVG